MSLLRKALVVAAFGLAGISSQADAATVALNPQSGVVLLSHNCGGIHTSTYVTGFDANGNITGEVYAWTKCGSGGRGGGYHITTYASWNSIVWDLSGNALVTLAYDGIVPDTAFTETDANGNVISTSQATGPWGIYYIGELNTP